MNLILSSECAVFEEALASKTDAKMVIVFGVS